MKQNKPVIGIIGAGRLGTAVARASLKAGYEVLIANSRGAESLSLQLSILLPGAQALPVFAVIRDADIIVLAIPLNQYTTLPADAFDGKIVIDAMNYWPPTEGDIPEFMNENVTSSEYIQQYLKGAKVVKTLNHIAYNELEEHALAKDLPGRRAMALSGDDAESKEIVSNFTDSLGFDMVDLGKLSRGSRFQPGTKLFNARYTVDDF